MAPPSTITRSHGVMLEPRPGDIAPKFPPTPGLNEVYILGIVRSVMAGQLCVPTAACSVGGAIGMVPMRFHLVQPSDGDEC